MKRFKISERQAEAILELRLRQLAKLEEIKIRAEQKELSEERKSIEQLLKSATRLKTFIKNEIKADAEKFGDERRSQLVEREESKAFSETELLSTEPVTIVLSERGWMRAAKGHEVDPRSLAIQVRRQFQDRSARQEQSARDLSRILPGRALFPAGPYPALSEGSGRACIGQGESSPQVRL
jgi:topoisomerase-4 subunit A